MGCCHSKESARIRTDTPGLSIKSIPKKHAEDKPTVSQDDDEPSQVINEIHAVAADLTETKKEMLFSPRKECQKTAACQVTPVEDVPVAEDVEEEVVLVLKPTTTSVPPPPQTFTVKVAEKLSIASSPTHSLSPQEIPDFLSFGDLFSSLSMTVFNVSLEHLKGMLSKDTSLPKLPPPSPHSQQTTDANLSRVLLTPARRILFPSAEVDDLQSLLALFAFSFTDPTDCLICVDSITVTGTSSLHTRMHTLAHTITETTCAVLQAYTEKFSPSFTTKPDSSSSSTPSPFPQEAALALSHFLVTAHTLQQRLPSYQPPAPVGLFRDYAAHYLQHHTQHLWVATAPDSILIPAPPTRDSINSLSFTNAQKQSFNAIAALMDKDEALPPSYADATAADVPQCAESTTHRHPTLQSRGVSRSADAPRRLSSCSTFAPTPLLPAYGYPCATAPLSPLNSAQTLHSTHQTNSSTSFATQATTATAPARTHAFFAPVGACPERLCRGLHLRMEGLVWLYVALHTLTKAIVAAPVTSNLVPHAAIASAPTPPYAAAPVATDARGPLQEEREEDVDVDMFPHMFLLAAQALSLLAHTQGAGMALHWCVPRAETASPLARSTSVLTTVSGSRPSLGPAAALAMTAGVQSTGRGVGTGAYSTSLWRAQSLGKHRGDVTARGTAVSTYSTPMLASTSVVTTSAMPLMSTTPAPTTHPSFATEHVHMHMPMHDRPHPLAETDTDTRASSPSSRRADTQPPRHSRDTHTSRLAETEASSVAADASLLFPFAVLTKRASSLPLNRSSTPTPAYETPSGVVAASPAGPPLTTTLATAPVSVASSSDAGDDAAVQVENMMDICGLARAAPTPAQAAAAAISKRSSTTTGAAVSTAHSSQSHMASPARTPVSPPVPARPLLARPAASLARDSTHDHTSASERAAEASGAYRAADAPSSVYRHVNGAAPSSGPTHTMRPRSAPLPALVPPSTASETISDLPDGDADADGDGEGVGADVRGGLHGENRKRDATLLPSPPNASLSHGAPTYAASGAIAGTTGTCDTDSFESSSREAGPPAVGSRATPADGNTTSNTPETTNGVIPTLTNAAAGAVAYTPAEAMRAIEGVSPTADHRIHTHLQPHPFHARAQPPEVEVTSASPTMPSSPLACRPEARERYGARQPASSPAHSSVHLGCGGHMDDDEGGEAAEGPCNTAMAPDDGAQAAPSAGKGKGAPHTEGEAGTNFILMSRLPSAAPTSPVPSHASVEVSTVSPLPHMRPHNMPSYISHAHASHAFPPSSSGLGVASHSRALHTHLSHTPHAHTPHTPPYSHVIQPRAPVAFASPTTSHNPSSPSYRASSPHYPPSPLLRPAATSPFSRAQQPHPHIHHAHGRTSVEPESALEGPLSALLGSSPPQSAMRVPSSAFALTPEAAHMSMLPPRAISSHVPAASTNAVENSVFSHLTEGHSYSHALSADANAGVLLPPRPHSVATVGDSDVHTTFDSQTVYSSLDAPTSNSPSRMLGDYSQQRHAAMRDRNQPTLTPTGAAASRVHGSFSNDMRTRRLHMAGRATSLSHNLAQSFTMVPALLSSSADMHGLDGVSGDAGMGMARGVRRHDAPRGSLCDLRHSDLRTSDLRTSDLRGSDARASDIRASTLTGGARGGDVRYEMRPSEMRGSVCVLDARSTDPLALRVSSDESSMGPHVLAGCGGGMSPADTDGNSGVMSLSAALAQGGADTGATCPGRASCAGSDGSVATYYTSALAVGARQRPPRGSLSTAGASVCNAGTVCVGVNSPGEQGQMTERSLISRAVGSDMLSYRTLAPRANPLPLQLQPSLADSASSGYGLGAGGRVEVLGDCSEYSMSESAQTAPVEDNNPHAQAACVERGVCSVRVPATPEFFACISPPSSTVTLQQHAHAQAHAHTPLHTGQHPHVSMSPSFPPAHTASLFCPPAHTQLSHMHPSPLLLSSMPPTHPPFLSQPLSPIPSAREKEGVSDDTSSACTDPHRTSIVPSLTTTSANARPTSLLASSSCRSLDRPGSTFAQPHLSPSLPRQPSLQGSGPTPEGSVPLPRIQSLTFDCVPHAHMHAGTLQLSSTRIADSLAASSSATVSHSITASPSSPALSRFAVTATNATHTSTTPGSSAPSSLARPPTSAATDSPLLPLSLLALNARPTRANTVQVQLAPAPSSPQPFGPRELTDAARPAAHTPSTTSRADTHATDTPVTATPTASPTPAPASAPAAASPAALVIPAPMQPRPAASTPADFFIQHLPLLLGICPLVVLPSKHHPRSAADPLDPVFAFFHHFDVAVQEQLVESSVMSLAAATVHGARNDAKRGIRSLLSFAVQARSPTTDLTFTLSMPHASLFNTPASPVPSPSSPAAPAMTVSFPVFDTRRIVRAYLHPRELYFSAVSQQGTMHVLKDGKRVTLTVPCADTAAYTALRDLFHLNADRTDSDALHLPSNTSDDVDRDRDKAKKEKHHTDERARTHAALITEMLNAGEPVPGYWPASIDVAPRVMARSSTSKKQAQARLELLAFARTLTIPALLASPHHPTHDCDVIYLPVPPHTCKPTAIAQSPTLVALTGASTQVRVVGCPECIAAPSFQLNPSYFRRRARVVTRRNNPLPMISLAHLRKPRHAAGMRAVAEMLGMFPSAHASSSKSTSGSSSNTAALPTCPARPGMYLFAADREYQWLPHTYVDRAESPLGGTIPPRHLPNPGYDTSSPVVTANAIVSVDTNVSPLRVFVYHGGDGSGVTPHTYIYRGVDVLQCALSTHSATDPTSTATTDANSLRATSSSNGSRPPSRSTRNGDIPASCTEDSDDYAAATAQLCLRAERLLACMDAEDQCAARYNALLDSLEARFNGVFAHVLLTCTNLLACPEVCTAHPYVAMRPYECDAQEDIAGAKLLRLPSTAARVWEEDLASVSSEGSDNYYRYSVMTTVDELRSSCVKPFFEPRLRASTLTNRSSTSTSGHSGTHSGLSSSTNSVSLRPRATSLATVPAVLGEQVEYDAEGRPMVDAEKEHRIAKEFPLRGVLPRLKLPKK